MSVAVLLCVDEYLKKSVKKMEAKRRKGIETRQPSSSEIHKEVPYRSSRSSPGDTCSGLKLCGESSACCTDKRLVLS